MPDPSPRRIGVIGLGVVGTQTVRELLDTTNHDVALPAAPKPAVAELLATLTPGEAARTTHLPQSSGRLTSDDDHGTPDIVVLCTPGSTQPALARQWMELGASIVAVTDDLATTKALLGLHDDASRLGVRIIVGAGMMPGLSCALAQLGASRLDVVTEIHAAKHGTAGPSCARQHHRALRSPGHLLRDGVSEKRPGGSGRELVWFPEPIEGADCYFAELPDPLLFGRSHPRLERATARVAANRRDRFTSRLPVLMPPHAQGGVGAIRIELRGLRDGQPDTVVYGAAGRPGTIAAVVAAAVAVELGNESPELPPCGSFGVGELRADRAILPRVRHRGVVLETFEGVNGRD